MWQAIQWGCCVVAGIVAGQSAQPAVTFVAFVLGMVAAFAIERKWDADEG